MVDQNSIFGGMLTTQGAAKKTNCDALGIPWEPSHMLIGDANGTDPVPSPSQTKLINQRYRAQINQLFVSPVDENVLIAELVLPPDVGGWWIRELALEDKDGVFSAVANVAPSYKPLLAQGSGRNQVVRMHIITSGTSNIQLKIDPSVVLATRKYVDDSVKSALPADKEAGQFTRVTADNRGIIQSGDNPETLAGMGIKDAYTKEEVLGLTGQATEPKRGTAKIATQALTDAGTDDATIVTPKKLRWGFQILKAPNGYIVFPSWLGGLIIQWGTVTGTVGDLAGGYPIQFPNGVLQAVAGLGDKSSGALGGMNLYVTGSGMASKTTLTLRSNGSDGLGTTTARYIAIGH